MKKLFILVLMFLTGSTWVGAQVTPCNCTANVASGDRNFSSLTWTGTGCPTAGSTSYSGNLCVNLANGANLIMDKNFTIAGGFGISNSGNSTFTVPSGFTLSVSGNMGDDSNNNVSFTINGTLNVGGTLFGKNGNAFAGSGTVNAGGLDFNQAPTCNTSTTCTIDWSVGTCQPSASTFCTVTVLPVTLLFFEANAYPEYVELKWATASELNLIALLLKKHAMEIRMLK